jgi:Lon protease-like protein
MMNFIPIFPLSLVVYPGEQLNLHIFEPRYKQLVNECAGHKKPFGIPVVINNKVSEYGTVMELEEIVKTYDNGEMDIRTRGLKVFRMLEIVPDVPDRLCGGAIVEYPDNRDLGSSDLMQKVLEAIGYLHKMLNVSKKFSMTGDQLRSYDVAHHAGLALEQEYELLCLMDELQRQEYLRRHLQNVLPVVVEMESLKEKVKLNGHFKNLSGFKFEDDLGDGSTKL